jgi:hypothetical protein
MNVTGCKAVPTLGTVAGEVKANIPATDADPPLNVDEESACPDVMALAVGATKITGAILFTVKYAVALVITPDALLTTTS